MKAKSWKVIKENNKKSEFTRLQCEFRRSKGGYGVMRCYRERELRICSSLSSPLLRWSRPPLLLAFHNCYYLSNQMYLYQIHFLFYFQGKHRFIIGQIHWKKSKNKFFIKYLMGTILMPHMRMYYCIKLTTK